MIVGRALVTTVADRTATNRPINSPVSASMICLCVMGASLTGSACSGRDVVGNEVIRRLL
jgi:hypothetical protein